MEYLLQVVNDFGIFPDLMALSWALPYVAVQQTPPKFTILLLACEPHLLQKMVPPRTWRSCEGWVEMCPIWIMQLCSLTGTPLLCFTGLHEVPNHSLVVLPLTGKLHIQTMHVTREWH